MGRRTRDPAPRPSAPIVAPPRTMPYRVVSPPPGVPQLYRTIASALRMCPPGGCVEKFDWAEGNWLQLEQVKHRRPRALEDSREVTTVLSGGAYKKICELCGKNGETVSSWIRAAVEGRLVGPDR